VTDEAPGLTDRRARSDVGTISAPSAEPRRAGRVRTSIRWIAIVAAGSAQAAVLALELLERPGYDVVLFSVGAAQWQPTMHFLFLASVCVALGTIAHQLAGTPRRLGRVVAWVLGPLLTVCGVAISILFLLFIAIASVRQYVTITADDGTQFLVRAKTWHHTRYTVLEPAVEWGPWYSDGATIVTADPNNALANGDYVLRHTRSGYHLTFNSVAGEGPGYELEW